MRSPELPSLQSPFSGLGALLLAAALVSLPLWTATAQSLDWTKDLSSGIKAGSLIGHTDLANEMAPQFQGFLRHPIVPHLEGELGGGYGRVGGEQYGTDMGLVDMKLLWAPFPQRWWKPYIYGGLGLLRYDMDKISPLRSAGTRRIDWGGTVPAGLGLQIQILEDAALEINGGYTYTFLDDLDAVRMGGDRDAFWSLSIGVVVSQFGGLERVPRHLVEAPPPAQPPPAAPEPPLTDTDGDGLTDEVEKLMFFTNPLLADSDGDSLTDREEIQVYRTDPNKADTDGGTVGDGAEIARSGNALNSADDVVQVAEKALPEFEQIYFGFDSAELTVAARQQLDGIAAEMDENPEAVLDISGHTDLIGNRDYNLKLSQRRAEAVERYLVEKGIPAWRLRVRALGQEEPVVAASAEGANERNRRVELLFRKM